MKESCNITVNKFNFRIFIWVFATVFVGIIIGVFYFGFYSKQYTPPSFDSAAIFGTPEIDEDKYGYSLIRIQEQYNIKICGEPNIENNNMECYLTNLEGNNVLIKGVIYSYDNQILGESGVISPGEYVKSIEIKTPLPKGEHDFTIKILGFEPKTYYSMGVANLKTKLKIY